MKDIRNRLEAADPLPREPPLSELDIQRMRRTVVAADLREGVARSSRWLVRPGDIGSRARGWFDWRWAVVPVVIAVAAGVGVNRWLAAQRVTDPAAEALDAPMPLPRQLQFFTAGGTRVIWVFNPEF